MKTLRRLCAAFMLTLALTLSAFAGDMTTMIVSPPPPASQTTTSGDMSTTVAGQMDTTVTGDMPTGIAATDSTLLNLLQGVLSIF